MGTHRDLDKTNTAKKALKNVLLVAPYARHLSDRRNVDRIDWKELQAVEQEFWLLADFIRKAERNIGHVKFARGRQSHPKPRRPTMQKEVNGALAS